MRGHIAIQRPAAQLSFSARKIYGIKVADSTIYEMKVAETETEPPPSNLKNANSIIHTFYISGNKQIRSREKVSLTNFAAPPVETHLVSS
jgi:hypothetical protein